MSIRVILALAVFALPLCGCEDSPAQVKEKMAREQEHQARHAEAVRQSDAKFARDRSKANAEVRAWIDEMEGKKNQSMMTAGGGAGAAK